MADVDLKQLAKRYLDTISRKEFSVLDEMLAPDLRFKGPAMTLSTSKEFVAALRRLSAVQVRNDVQRIFVDGNEVLVIYDLVTDTPAGSFPTIEWLRVEEGLIQSIDLYYDRVPWKSVTQEIGQRAAS